MPSHENETFSQIWNTEIWNCPQWLYSWFFMMLQPGHTNMLICKCLWQSSPTPGLLVAELFGTNSRRGEGKFLAPSNNQCSGQVGLISFGWQPSQEKENSDHKTGQMRIFSLGRQLMYWRLHKQLIPQLNVLIKLKSGWPLHYGLQMITGGKWQQLSVEALSRVLATLNGLSTCASIHLYMGDDQNRFNNNQRQDNYWNSESQCSTRQWYWFTREPNEQQQSK